MNAQSKHSFASSPGPGEPACEVSPRGRLVAVDTTDSERTHALWVHLGALVASLVSAGFLIPLVVALVVWQIRKDSAFVDDHGREGLNFQLSLLLYQAATFPIGLLTCGVGFLLLPVIWVLWLVGMILGAIAANRGEYFRYPACVRFF